jgi:hypothetical protein
MSFDSQAERSESQAMLYQGDGLLDILIGLGILIFGLTITFDMVYLGGAYIAILAAIMPALKRGITAPRMQFVDDAPAPEARRRGVRFGLLVLLGLGVLVFLGLLLFWRADAIPAWLIAGIGDYGLLLAGVALVALLVVTGWATGKGRFVAYAALAALASAAGHWLGIGFWLYAVLVGASVTLGGIAVLVRFVRKYPKVGQPQD